MDVNQKTVEKYMLDAGVDLLIHGHTHRPKRHDFQLDGRDRSRWVLAQWFDNQAEIIVGSGGSLRAEKIKSTQ